MPDLTQDAIPAEETQSIGDETFFVDDDADQEAGEEEAQPEQLESEEAVEESPAVEEPKQPQTPPQTDAVYEVEGLGRITGSEIRALKLQESLYRGLEEGYQQLEEATTAFEQERTALNAVRPIKELMDSSPAIQKAVMQAIAKVTADMDNIPREQLYQPQGKQAAQSPSPIEQQLLQQQAELDEMRLGNSLDQIGREYSDVWTPALKQQAIVVALAEYADNRPAFTSHAVVSTAKRLAAEARLEKLKPIEKALGTQNGKQVPRLLKASAGGGRKAATQETFNDKGKSTAQIFQEAPDFYHDEE